MAETDLYQPLHDYLVAQGYTVRSEVRGCDITAVKGEEVVVIEMKRSFGTTLLIQATQRQRITDSVYVALPVPTGRYQTERWAAVQHLLRRLELGLILVAVGQEKRPVQVVFHPLPFDRKKRKQLKRAVLREAQARSLDLNLGGSHRRRIITAYRENAVHIACCLDALGPLSPRQLRSLGTGPKTLSILSRDVYGWFERIGPGLYALRAQGREEIRLYPALLKRFRPASPPRLEL
jgi:hypothetical protein